MIFDFAKTDGASAGHSSRHVFCRGDGGLPDRAPPRRKVRVVRDNRRYALEDYGRRCDRRPFLSVTRVGNAAGAVNVYQSDLALRRHMDIVMVRQAVPAAGTDASNCVEGASDLGLDILQDIVEAERVNRRQLGLPHIRLARDSRTTQPLLVRRRPGIRADDDGARGDGAVGGAGADGLGRSVRRRRVRMIVVAAVVVIMAVVGTRARG
jgi:hypothetical protein